MKYYLVLALSLLSMNLSKAHAESTINITTGKHSYSMYTNLMMAYADDHQDNLGELLGNHLECRLVKVKMNVYAEPRLFKKGLYDLTVTAFCNKAFSNMAIEVGYSEDYGNPWSLTVTYNTPDGKNHKLYSEAADRD